MKSVLNTLSYAYDNINTLKRVLHDAKIDSTRLIIPHISIYSQWESIINTIDERDLVRILIILNKDYPNLCKQIEFSREFKVFVRNTLAALYKDKDTIYRILYEIELNTSFINISNNSINAWHFACEHAISQNCFEKLFPYLFLNNVKLSNAENNQDSLLVKKLSPNARITHSAGDAGYDLYSSLHTESIVCNPLQVIKINTGIAMKIPEGYYGLIKERSSLGSNGWAVRAGVIDSTYTGEIIVCIQNLSNTHEILYFNKAIAQIIFQKHEEFGIEYVDELPKTIRGTNGFGSTDNK